MICGKDELKGSTSKSQSLDYNQSVNHEALSCIATSRLNCYRNNAVRQSLKYRSDDEVWIRLSEEPCLEMLTE